MVAKSSLKDDEYYEVKLTKPVEWPPGSKRMLPAGGARVTVRGKSAKNFADVITEAKPKGS